MKRHFSLIVTFLAVLALFAAGFGFTGNGLGGNSALAAPGENAAGYTVDFAWQGAA